ncbi:unnamed protein product, partial [Mesorhabditis belari]|uniref:Chromatin assembly factor 1 subunit A n=1 Tax=Mesorhabditis belari TaxID=2138241 RepID=A0AAF3F5T6_9BILA
MDIEAKENHCEETQENPEKDGSSLPETRKRAHSDDEVELKKSKIDLFEVSSDSDHSESQKSIVELPENEEDAASTTPKMSRRSSTAHPPHSTRTPMGLNKKMGLREQERLKKTEEKLRAKEERERQLELKRQEKEKKEREREEKRREEERKKEEKRKEEEKKKEEKQREAEERMKEKEEKKKEEEERKRKKDEERELKKQEEEEKRKKKEEEKLQLKREKEEQREAKRREEEAAKAAEEEKKRRQSTHFKNFFKVEKKIEKASEKPEEKEKWFQPFHLKEGATLAPIHRRDVLPSDWILKTFPDEVPSTYLDSIKPSRKLVLASRTDALKAKLFHFHTNYRPPYYGTWRKRAGQGVSGKNPFGKMVNLDYENDSDSEWEEEPEDADECRSDEEEEVEKDEDEDEEDDDEGFFVEPGYLSDGEGDVGEESGERAAQGTTETAEVRAERLAGRAKVWEQSVNRKKQLLVATILGPNFKNPPAPCELLQVVIF